MTPMQTRHAEQDARIDAEKLALLLLLLFKRKRGFGGRAVAYDASTAKFRIDDRAISIRSIRMYLNRIQDKLAVRLELITTRLENKEITFAEWQREFERTISSAHILAGALVLGSITAAAQHRFVQQQIVDQIGFADDFAKDIRKKKAGSWARIKARAKSYSRASHLTFSNLELQVRTAVGVDTESRRILRANESCHSSAALLGCIELAANGWGPIEKTVPLGKTPCKQYCRCYIEYR